MIPTGFDVARVEAVLATGALGRRVAIAGAERLAHDDAVWRCTLAPSEGLPSTVVAKFPRTDPRDPRSRLDCIHNERAALEFLAARDFPLTPRVIAAGGRDVLVIEDLGPLPRLYDLLEGSDYAAAEEAMVGFGRALGRLHASTLGAADAYYERRRAVGPVDVERDRLSVVWREHTDDLWEQLKVIVTRLDLPLPGPHVEHDVADVTACLVDPGAYLALSSGDPGNANYLLDGREGRWVDFETAGFRHALIDAAILPFAFLNSPWGVFPQAVTTRAEAAYRAELLAALPRGAEDAFAIGMAAACAACAIMRLIRLPRIDSRDQSEEDAFRRRTQIINTIDVSVRAADEATAFRAFRDWLGDLSAAFRARWPEADSPPPLRRAFR